jgi:hypothetical protein
MCCTESGLLLPAAAVAVACSAYQTRLIGLVQTTAANAIQFDCGDDDDDDDVTTATEIRSTKRADPPIKDRLKSRFRSKSLLDFLQRRALSLTVDAQRRISSVHK